ncbi:MAG: PilZ domain-containing protein [Spirochaetaceae bacterium]|nr:PilZ domain-containing protein [Spirochaetaceae bacterium]
MAQRNSRYASNGRVYIAEVSNAKILLKNLSAGGLCITSEDSLEISPKARYSVEIIPEENSQVDTFKVDVESRWVKAKKQFCESGCVMIIPAGTPSQEVLEQYLAYLAGKAEDP